MLYYILQWDSFYIEQKLFLLQAFSDHYEKLTAPPGPHRPPSGLYDGDTAHFLNQERVDFSIKEKVKICKYWTLGGSFLLS